MEELTFSVARMEWADRIYELEKDSYPEDEAASFEKVV